MRARISGRNCRVWAALRMCTFVWASLLVGCSIGRVSYKTFQITGAVYFGDVCYGAGPPSLAYYPYHGIFISLSLDGDTMELGLHVPAEVTASLEGSEVKITGQTARGDTVTIVGILRALRHGSFGATTPKSAPFLWNPDPYKSATTLRGLTGGGTRASGYYWYVFGMFANENSLRVKFLPHDLVKGVVEMPAISVNGVRYPSQRIGFVEKAATKLMPVNC